MLEATRALARSRPQEKDIFLVRRAAHHVGQRTHNSFGIVGNLLLVVIALANKYYVVRNAFILKLSLLPVWAYHDGGINKSVIIGRLKYIWLWSGIHPGLSAPCRWRHQFQVNRSGQWIWRLTDHVHKHLWSTQIAKLI